MHVAVTCHHLPHTVHQLCLIVDVMTLPTWIKDVRFVVHVADQQNNSACKKNSFQSHVAFLILLTNRLLSLRFLRCELSLYKCRNE